MFDHILFGDKFFFYQILRSKRRKKFGELLLKKIIYLTKHALFNVKKNTYFSLLIRFALLKY